MMRLNIGSEEEFNELQAALQHYLLEELEALERTNEPGMREAEEQHEASIKILKSLLKRLEGLDKLKSFKNKKNEDY